MSEPVPMLNPAASAAAADAPETRRATADPASTAAEPPRKAAEPPRKAAKNDVRGGANMYGFCSLEKFCDAGGLSYTHDDALGFYNYVKQFNQPNFWYQDGGVGVWQYYEPYDHWQDTYGADAVRVFYHSGHGGMGSDGTFYVPVGFNWGGYGCTAVSSQMTLADERLRYLFWSTCLSLRVMGGQSPIKTWNKANKGLRMIFGFETISYDNPNYGKFFFEEWNKNKSFSQAWLDASWRISHHQAPSVCACGASEQEAKARVFNERMFYDGRVSTSWWWWRWYNAAAAARDLITSAPVLPQIAELAPVSADARGLFERFELGGALAEDGAGSYAAGDRGLSRAADGSFSARLGSADLDNAQPPSMATIRAAADALIDRLALRGSGLVLDRVIEAAAAGGTDVGSGEIAAPRTTETIVQYRQTIDGIPIISPDAGTLRVAIDNNGDPVRVDGALREVVDVTGDSRTAAPRQPQPDGSEREATEERAAPEPQAPHEAALAQAAADRLRTLIGRGASPLGVTVVPGTTEIGYAVRENVAELVATQSVEVDFGQGYRKRYQIEVPLAG